MPPDLDLLQNPIPHLLRKLAIPAGTGYFFITMFNVVDTFYAGRISTHALAAMGFAFPLYFLLIAVGGGISIGATALTGHALGAGDQDNARLYAAQTLSFAVLHSLILAAIGIMVAPLLFSLMGARDDYLALAQVYICTIFSGAPFIIFNHAMNSILNASGDTRSFRNFLVAAFLLDLLLDPWFLFGGVGIPAMGLAGIALATVVIHMGGNIYLIGQVRKTGLIDRRTFALLIPRWLPFKDLFKQGIPASLSMLTVALGVFIITIFVGRFGHDPVAAYGVATRIEQVAIMPVMGLNIATLALVSQNSGARNFARVRETVLHALWYGFMLSLCTAALVYIFAMHLAGFFSQDPTVVAIAAGYLHFSAFTLPAYLILYICGFTLQGLKKPIFGVLLGIYRQIVMPIPVFWLLAVLAGLGVSGIWWGIVTITWSAALIALLITLFIFRGLGVPGKETVVQKGITL